MFILLIIFLAIAPSNSASAESYTLCPKRPDGSIDYQSIRIRVEGGIAHYVRPNGDRDYQRGTFKITKGGQIVPIRSDGNANYQNGTLKK